MVGRGRLLGLSMPSPLWGQPAAVLNRSRRFSRTRGRSLGPRSAIHKKTHREGGFFYVWWVVGDSNARPID